VRVELPAGVLPIVVTVSVELAPAAMEVELNEAVAPAGWPLTDKFTMLANPPSALVLIV
jgi:hypothetical protein